MAAAITRHEIMHHEIMHHEIMHHEIMHHEIMHHEIMHHGRRIAHPGGAHVMAQRSQGGIPSLLREP
jgi:hypothetical protein